MSQSALVARLALRELWISFRLFAILTVYVAAGAMVALVPAPLSASLERLAIGMAVAVLVSGMVAAWAMATERATGRAGWLMSRSVPRAVLVAGWFMALAAVVLAGSAAAGVLGWTAASSVSVGLSSAAYGAMLGALVATGLAAVALGLLAGTLVPPVGAMIVVLVVGVVAGVPAWLAPVDPTLLPFGSLAAMAQLREVDTTLAPGLRSAGLHLALAALFLAGARAALARAEL